ncbi:WXG100 family type VII secretion target [Gandjariella thermophila]|uniref:WXG100 family type VII secretion target n=1 Tax=Gandjariella thermophila TaxID=1931992 RepID=A0A4D4J464_9PSEU|nr:hypothetical protein [Gandjariella thermophila]GDY29306.1 hypothetical protein GTS_09390 [Gandjariella thermophila]
MADAPSWDDVKKLLDDPNVPDAEKAELAKNFEAYDDNWSAFGTEDRVQPYLDRYGGGYWNTQGRQSVDALEDLNPFSGASWSDGGHAKRYLIDSYNKAKASADQAAKDNKQHDDDVASGRHKLEDARNRAAGGGTGVGTSDELLDAGKPGLRYFDRFLPLYGKLPDTVRKNPPQGVTMTADFLHQRYDEHRGINFTHFTTDADEMASCAGTERGEHQEMANKLSTLWNHWTGPASRSSQEYFAGFARHVEKITQALDDTAQISKLAMHNIADAVRGKAQWLLDNDRNSDTYDGKSPGQIDVIIKCAAGTASDDELKQACGYVGVEVDDGACHKSTYQSKVTHAATAWLNRFAADMEGRVGAFIKTCDSTKSRVDDAFKSLTDQLGKITGDPFADQPADHGGDSGGHTAPSGAGGGGHAGGGGMPSGGASGGGGSAGGSVPPLGGAGTPGATGLPGAGGVPGAGGPPPGAGRTPDPRSPGAGQPVPAGYSPAAGTPQETVRIQDGRNTIQVAHPDGQGHVRLTVDPGNGQVKTYDLDFGGSAAGVLGTPAGFGQPGAGGAGPFGPGQPGPFAPGPPGLPGPADPAGAGLPGGGVPGGVLPVHAGPDGRAVVHDGPLTITAEHPAGAPDQLRITVDGGHGQPTSYTVDYAAPGGATSGYPPQPGAVPVGGPQPAAWAGGVSPGQPQPTGLPDGGPGAGPLAPPGQPPAPAPQYPPAAAAAAGYSAGDPGGYPTGGDPEPGNPGGGYPGGAGIPAGSPYGGGPTGPMSTVAASAGFGHPGEATGGGGSLWGAAGGGGDPHGTGGGQPGDIWGGQGGDHHPGLADTSAPQAGAAGDAGLAAMPDSGSGHGQQAGGAVAGGAMMPMMGGAMGAAGGQSGDQERSGSQWRTQGQLFDDAADGGRAVRGVLGADDRGATGDGS